MQYMSQIKEKGKTRKSEHYIKRTLLRWQRCIRSKNSTIFTKSVSDGSLHKLLTIVIIFNSLILTLCTMGKLFFSRGRGAQNDWKTNGAKYKVI